MARGEILRLHLPKNLPAGYEQHGTRPCVVLQVEPPQLKTIVIVPFTTNLKRLNLPYTLHVLASRQNGLAEESVALVYQIRATDRSRIIETIGLLEGDYMAQIDRLMRQMLGL